MVSISCFTPLKQAQKMNCKLMLTLALVALASAAVPWEPIPRNESWWKLRHRQQCFQTRTYAAEVKIVFLGDAFMEAWTRSGSKIWKEHYEPRHAFNYGL